MRSAFLLGLALLPVTAALGEPRTPLDGLRLEELSATRDRPLFAPTRRPAPALRVEAPQPASTEPTVAVPEAQPFELLGAAVGTHVSIALLRNKTTGEVLRLRPGDQAEGWRVGSVGLRSVALERDGREETLALVGAGVATGEAEVASDAPPADSSAAPVVPDLRRIAPRPNPDR